MTTTRELAERYGRGVTARVQRFEIVYEPDEDGGFHVSVPLLKGCHSWGATRDEARRNAREAILVWLERARAQGWTLPQVDTVDVRVE